MGEFSRVPRHIFISKGFEAEHALGTHDFGSQEKRSTLEIYSLTAMMAEHVEDVKNPSAALSRAVAEGWNSEKASAPIERPVGVRWACKVGI